MRRSFIICLFLFALCIPSVSFGDIAFSNGIWNMGFGAYGQPDFCGDNVAHNNTFDLFNCPGNGNNWMCKGNAADTGTGLDKPCILSGSYQLYNGFNCDYAHSTWVTSGTFSGGTTTTLIDNSGVDFVSIGVTAGMGISRRVYSSAYTDLKIDAVNSQKVSSSGHSFSPNEPGNYIKVTAGTGFTPGKYLITSVGPSGSYAIVDSSVGTLGSSGGSFSTSNRTWTQITGVTSNTLTFATSPIAAPAAIDYTYQNNETVYDVWYCNSGTNYSNAHLTTDAGNPLGSGGVGFRTYRGPSVDCGTHGLTTDEHVNNSDVLPLGGCSPADNLGGGGNGGGGITIKLISTPPLPAEWWIRYYTRFELGWNWDEWPQQIKFIYWWTDGGATGGPTLNSQCTALYTPCSCCTGYKSGTCSAAGGTGDIVDITGSSWQLSIWRTTPQTHYDFGNGIIDMYPASVGNNYTAGVSDGIFRSIELHTRLNTYGSASQVIGTDGKNYTAIPRMGGYGQLGITGHVSDATNRPITGASWATYWAQTGNNGVAWQSGTTYVVGDGVFDFWIDGVPAPVGPTGFGGHITGVKFVDDWIPDTRAGRTSQVIGSDGRNYACMLGHTADSTNQPVTGANWKIYWTQTGSLGSAWVSGSTYIVQGSGCSDSGYRYTVFPHNGGYWSGITALTGDPQHSGYQDFDDIAIANPTYAGFVQDHVNNINMIGPIGWTGTIPKPTGSGTTISGGSTR